jgi:hypothetical protein
MLECTVGKTLHRTKVSYLADETNKVICKKKEWAPTRHENH